MSVLTVKDALLNVLTARAGLAGVTLTWAVPTKDEDFTAEMVILGDSEETSNWQQIGGGLRSEDFRLELVVFVEQWGDDAKATEQRARAIWSEVEDALRDDLYAQPSTLRTAGLLDFGDGEVSRRVTTGPASAEKWGCRVDASFPFRIRNV